MNSLKKKFGKFAVSTEKMAKINGGGWSCWDSSGNPVPVPASIEEMETAAKDGKLDGCSN